MPDGHLEADGLAEAAPVQLELDGGQQVLGVVLVHRQVGVAGDPEDVVLGDRHRREEGVEMGGDDLLDRARSGCRRAGPRTGAGAAGTFTRAIRCSPVAGSTTRSTRLRQRFEM